MMLEDVIGRARFKRSNREFFAQRARYKHERNIRTFLPREMQGGQAVKSRKAMVGKNQVGLLSADFFEELFACLNTSEGELQSALAQFLFDQHCVLWPILQHYDA